MVTLHQHSGGSGSIVNWCPVKKCPCYNHYENRNGNGDNRADKGIKFAHFDILFLQSFVNNRALLKKQHPRCNGRTDISHEQKKQLIIEAARKIRNQSLTEDTGN